MNWKWVQTIGNKMETRHEAYLTLLFIFQICDFPDT